MLGFELQGHRQLKLVGLFFFLLLLGCQQRYSGKVMPKVNTGVLDLSGWDFDRDGPIDVEGDFKFVWMKNFGGSEQEFAEVKEFIHVPRNWTTGQIGYGSYLLKIVGAPSSSSNLAIFASRIPSASEIRILDHEGSRTLASRGKIGQSTESEIAWQESKAYPFKISKEGLLSFQFSNFHRSYTAFKSLKIGEYSQIESLVQFAKYKSAFIAAALLILAFVNLFLFIHQKNDLASLYLSVYIVLYLLRIIVMDNWYYAVLPVTAFYSRLGLQIEYLGISIIGLTALFLKASFNPVFNPRVVRLLLLCSMSQVLVILLFQESVIDGYLVHFIQLSNLIGGLYLIYGISRAVHQKIPGARYSLVGSCLYTAFAINDMFVAKGIVTTPYIAEYGLVLFLFCQTQITGIRFKAAYENNLYLSKKLAEQEAQRTVFFHNTSHELRTPLNGILGFLGLMKQGSYGPIPQLLLPQLDKVEQLAQSLKLQVNTILDLAKSKKQQLTLHSQLISLDQVKQEIDIIAEGLCLKNQNRQWRSELILVDPQLRTFASDRDKLFTILRNLVGNAFKFADSARNNSVSLRIAVDSARMLSIEVQDTGIGIPKDQIGKLFQEFSQVETDARRRYEGTGLGLAMVKELVQLLGGTIELSSEVDVGSIFRILLPEQKELSTALPETEELNSRAPITQPESALPLADAKANQGYEILVVDDNELNCEVVCGVLRHEGYGVHALLSGRQALNYLEKNEPDLIVLDLMMPEVSGEDALKAMRKDKRWQNIPVIILTARASDEDLLQGLAMGADDYLPKPIVVPELLLRIRNTLFRVQVTRLNQDLKNAERMAKLGDLTGELVHEIKNIQNSVSFYPESHGKAIKTLLSTVRQSIPSQLWYDLVEQRKIPYPTQLRGEALTPFSLVGDISAEKRKLLKLINFHLKFCALTAAELQNIIQSLSAMDLESLANLEASLLISCTVLSMHQQAQRYGEIIHSVLGFSRLEDRQLINLADLIKETLILCGPRLKKAGISIDNQCQDSQTVLANPSEIRQILLNLLLNSHDALRSHPEVKQPQIRLSWQAAAGKLALAIEDNAGGIPPAIAAQLFTSNFTTKGAAGNGKGLALSRKLAQQNGGSLIFDETSQATRFVLTLPNSEPTVTVA
jgi:signal transduction histidine kinase